MKVSGKVFFDGILVTIFAVMVVISFGYNKDARLVPLLVGIPSLVLSLILFLADGFPALGQKLTFTRQRGVSAGGARLPDHDREDKNESKSSYAAARKAEIIKALRVFGWLALLTLLLGVLNYYIAILAFILLFMLWESKVRLRTALLVAAGTEGFIFLLFGLLLKATF